MAAEVQNSNSKFKIQKSKSGSRQWAVGSGQFSVFHFPFSVFNFRFHCQLSIVNCQFILVFRFPFSIFNFSNPSFGQEFNEFVYPAHGHVEYHAVLKGDPVSLRTIVLFDVVQVHKIGFVNPEKVFGR